MLQTSMPEVELYAKVRKWGNSFGVILPKKLTKDLNIRPGETVHIKIEYTPARNNTDNLPKWDFITDYDIDRIMEEETQG